MARRDVNLLWGKSVRFFKCSAHALLLSVACLLSQAGLAATQMLATSAVRSVNMADTASFDGVVEAVRQSVIAAQISGAIVAIDVKPGDAVKAGQVLLRIDSRAADQTAAASDAQVNAANASLEVATKEFERQRQLFEKRYISQMALDRAEAQFKSTQAQARARIAEASATRTQSGFYVIKAPYAGIVAKVPVVLGDMAQPGQPLLTLYDPKALRVTAAVPQGEVSGLSDKARQSIKVEFPDQNADSSWLIPAHVQVLPTVDASTHTVELRLDLPAVTLSVVPGMFTRVWLPLATNGSQTGRDGTRLYVPAKAIVQRAEMTGLYVIDASGKPRLRQVRTGYRLKDEIEILTGVNAGERVALDPDAAARQP